MLESADTDIALRSATAAAVALEEPDEHFDRSRLGLVAWIAIGWIGLVVAIALLAPVLPIKNPTVGDYLHSKAGLFTSGHILGSDDSGRDVLSRVIWARAPRSPSRSARSRSARWWVGSSGSSPVSRAARPIRS